MNMVNQVGWFGRIGRSIKGIFAGFVFALIAVVLLIANERNAVRDIRTNKEIAKEVTSVANDKVDAAKEGKLIHLNGPAQTDDIVEHPKFGIKENAIRLSWDAEIYQWIETEKNDTTKNTGGSETTTTTYSYDKGWVSEPIDSSKFNQPTGHENPPGQTFHSGLSQAKDVTVGSFNLPEPLISKISSSEPHLLEEIPTALASETANINNGIFHTGDAITPAVGDERVSFSLTKPQDVTVMAVQSNNTFEPYISKNGKTRFILMEGLLSATEVVQAEEQKAKFLRWVGRLGGFLLMSLGFGLILKPLSVLADVVPFFGNLVGAATGVIAGLFAGGLSLIIIAVFWVTFRPLIGIPVLIIAVAAVFFGIKKLMMKRA